MRAFYLIFFSVFILALSHSSAQILVGPEVGVNYSWTTFSDKDLNQSYSRSPVLGYHVGGHLAFLVRKRFFLHASLLYATKGRLIEGKDDKLLKNSATYNFIDMPVSYTVDFRGKIGDNKEFKYFLGIGPDISYWLGGKGTFYNIDYAESGTPEIKYKIVFKKSTFGEKEMNVEQPNRLQLGLNFIAGLVLEPAPRQRIMLSARYELGHSYLAKSGGIFQNAYYQDPLRSRNQGFRISVAYLYDLKTEDRKKGKSTIDRRKLR